MDEVSNSRILQYVTAIASYVPLLLALRAWRRYEVLNKLIGEPRRIFRRMCGDTAVQYMVALGAPIGYVLIQSWAGNQDLASNLTNTYLTAAALAGIASLWNVYKAHQDTEAASKAPTNKARAVQLLKVNEKNLSGYSPALISFVLGTLGLVAYNLHPSAPRWSWCVAFLLTGFAAYGLVVSNAATTVATAYESNPNLGRKTLR